MSKLIIVCGLPGSGKTTLTKALSRKLNIFALQKDSIKENLYEIEGLSTLEHSKEVGLRSFRLLIKLAEEQIANNTDLIIESPFRHSQDRELLREWLSKHNINLYSIICQIPQTERFTRFRSRPRHKAHHDAERELKTDEEEGSDYEHMPGKQVWVTTDKPVEQLLQQILTDLNL